MAKFIIPQDVVEAEGGNRDDVFPKGLWQGTIEVVRIREIHQGEGGDFFLQQKGEYFADSCEVASIQIGENTALEEDQPDIGQMKYFEDNIILSYDGLNWDEYENVEDDPRWRLSQTQLRLTKLAAALGLTDESEDGVGPVDHFDELFRSTSDEPAEGLNGMGIRFKVFHRTFKKRDGSQGKEAQTAQYYPVE